VHELSRVERFRSAEVLAVMDENMAWMACHPLSEDREVRWVFTGEDRERIWLTDALEEGAKDLEAGLGGVATGDAEAFRAVLEDPLELRACALLRVRVDEVNPQLGLAHGGGGFGKIAARLSRSTVVPQATTEQDKGHRR